MQFSIAILAIALCAAAALGNPLEFRTQEIETTLGVGYAVSLVDVGGDGRLDIVVVDTERVVWYENPTWQRHTLIDGGTQRDNVCIAPHDINADGRVDFALGAGWRGLDTKVAGTVQWLTGGASPSDAWTLRAIAQEPSVHRIRWVDLEGDGRPELVVVPLLGPGTSGPNWDTAPIRILAYKIPADPAKDRWPIEVISEELHVAHNFWPTDLDADGRTDLLVASFEGVSLLTRSAEGRWTRTLIGAGNQESTPNKGASEIKHGRLADGRDYIATIEPWHGFQVAVYTRPPKENARPSTLWDRRVLDDELKWGHGVWCANLDGDADEELIIGVRDDKSETARAGVRIYDPQLARASAEGGGLTWTRELVDPGGVAVEDLAAADLDGDGRTDIVAVGRQTHNVRIYWNEGG